jgi:hypothetical protein
VRGISRPNRSPTAKRCDLAHRLVQTAAVLGGQCCKCNGGRGIRTPKSLRTPVFKFPPSLCADFRLLVSRCSITSKVFGSLRLPASVCTSLRRDRPGIRPRLDSGANQRSFAARPKTSKVFASISHHEGRSSRARYSRAFFGSARNGNWQSLGQC